jgi:hypothetical protein
VLVWTYVLGLMYTHGQFYVAVSRVTSVHNIKTIWNPKVDTPVTKNIVYVEVLLNQLYFQSYPSTHHLCCTKRSTDGGPQSRLCAAQTGLRSITKMILSMDIQVDLKQSENE